MDQTGHKNLLTRSIAGGAYGALVWGLYGIAEFLFDSVAPYLYNSSHALTDWHWRIGAFVLGCYVLVGISLGVTAGASLELVGASRRLLRPAVAATVVCAFLGQVLYRGLADRGLYMLLIGLAVLGLVGLSASGRLRFLSRLAHPVVIALVLAGAPAFRISDFDTPAGGAEVGRRATPRKGAPDVVLLVMDTVRADHTSVYGYARETTPHLRLLADQATVYTRAVASGNYSLPTHASMLTGLYPRRHGAHAGSPSGRLDTPLDSDFQTIAELLLHEGYSTLLAASNYLFFSPEEGLTQGFQIHAAPRIPSDEFHLRRVLVRGVRQTHMLWDFQRRYLSAESVNQTVYSNLEKIVREDAPFFLFVNYMDAHHPLVEPEQYSAPFLKGESPVNVTRADALWRRIRFRGGKMSARERRIRTAQYDGAIRYVDEQIGDLVSYLRQIGRFDNTLLIVTADHGEMLGENGGLGHVVDLCEAELHIPLIVKYPGETDPRVVANRASQVDFLPTILDVAGVKVPPGLDGVNLRSLDQYTGRVVFSEALHLKKSRLHKRERAAYFGDWKLVESADGPIRMFDLSKDPTELHNIYGPDVPAATEVRKRLEAWLAATPPFASRAESIDPAQLERLKDLGYVQ